MKPHDWEIYFKGLLVENRQVFIKGMNADTNNVMLIGSSLRLTVKKVIGVCKTLENNKSQLPGDITGELFEHWTDTFFDHIRLLFPQNGNWHI